jgi:hypothetical protein|tara:strand:- start:340 stop:600 length:261 start_codon:yes stop_codon:yes gene_type:complete
LADKKIDDKTLEDILKEIKTLSGKMPKNGEFIKMSKDISSIKERLFSPESGVLIRLHDVEGWKKNVTKALWFIFVALIGVVVKLIF